MKSNVTISITLIIILACSVLMCKNLNKTEYHNVDVTKIDTTNYLIAVADGIYELGVPFAFIDKKGDTIIPIGKYITTWTDTLRTFAIVEDKMLGMIGIDRNGYILFNVFRFDNGPDYIKEELFRVIRNGLIGYANKYGEIVIPCQFECAYYFENGKAKVSNECLTIKDHEYSIWESDSWYYIDHKGKRIN